MKKLAAYKEMINTKLKQALKYNEKTILIRPISSVGHFSHTQYGTDHTKEYCNYLDSLNIKYEIGNDSPRGGQLGKYISIKLDKRNAFIKSLCA